MDPGLTAALAVGASQYVAVLWPAGTGFERWIAVGTIWIVAVLVGTFEQIVAFFMCTTLCFVALAAAAVFVVRRRGPATSAFLAPGYPVTPALFALLVLTVVAMVAINRPLQALAGFALVLLGLPFSRMFVLPGTAPEAAR